MNARPRGGKVLADKRRHGRDLVAKVRLVKACDLGDILGAHPIQSPAQRRILKHHRLERCVARAFPDAEQGAIRCRDAIQPCCTGVDYSLAKVVVAVPFQEVAREACVMPQAVGDARHAAGQRDARVADAEPQGVAGADFDRDAALVGELFQLQGEGHHKAVKVRTCDVLQMHARLDTDRQGILNDAQKLFHRLSTGHLEFVENVIVRATGKDARLLNTHIFDELKVLLGGTNPARYFWILIPQRAAGIHCGAVIGTIEKELGLTDDPIGSPKLVQKTEQLDGLGDRIRGTGLLTVPKSGVADPQPIRWIHGHMAMVKGDLGNLVVGIEQPIVVRCSDILQAILVLGLLQSVRSFAKL